MCGIAGWVCSDPHPRDAKAKLVAMCDAIRHRGPDDDGYYLGPGVALGMRRLSIIDVAGGRQPLANEDETVRVVFNGEIYNYRALRQQLVTGGHRLTSQGDTETLAHLYEERECNLVHELRGMFAFALWDSRRRRLLLARDRLGIKPLYYWPTATGLAFASELRSLLTLDDFPRQVDPTAIGQYLTFGYIPDPLSVYRGVRKLPPGHLLTWDCEHGVTVRRYWSPIRPELPVHDEREAIEELDRLLAESVRMHLESDVPLGAFLSGGLDSSAVVAHMARQMDRPVKTFSIGFENAEYNEAPDAARLATAIGTEHTSLVVRPDADELVDNIIDKFDEPFGDSSALPTFIVSELARTQVTVALSGDGGDELFGGYTRYAEVLRRRELPPAVVRAALRRVARLLPHGTRGRNRLLDLGRTRWGRYAATVAQTLDPHEGGVARAALVDDAGSLDHVLDPWTQESEHRAFATRMMLVDIQSYLPGDILTKVDRMSMAVSLEARVPLLDHLLVEFALSLPASLTMRDGRGKWLFRQAIARVVPAETLTRPKRGFALPLEHWFRRELRYRLDALRRPASPMFEFVAPDAVRRVADEHERGRRDHSHLLWRLLALDLWLQSNASAPTTAGASTISRVRALSA